MTFEELKPVPCTKYSTQKMVQLKCKQIRTWFVELHFKLNILLQLFTVKNIKYIFMFCPVAT